jgi:hypothetical protein
MPIEGDSRASEALSARMEGLLNDPDIDEPITLGFVRQRLREALTGRGLKADRSQFGTEESLYAEIEALVEEFGEEAPASDFTAVKASEELSAVIEAILDDGDEEVAPTLWSLREAIAGGYFARLVGEGVIEAEQYESLLAEIEDLIGRYGRDIPVEELLRFE